MLEPLSSIGSTDDKIGFAEKNGLSNAFDGDAQAEPPVSLDTRDKVGALPYLVPISSLFNPYSVPRYPR